MKFRITAVAILFALMMSIVVGVTSCGRHWVKAEQTATPDTLTFTELPENVQSAYINYLARGKDRNVIATDSTRLKIEFKAVNADFSKMFWSYGYYLRINGKKIFLKYSPGKGLPFIVDEQYIYWNNELNITDYNYRELHYVRVRW